LIKLLITDLRYFVLGLAHVLNHHKKVALGLSLKALNRKNVEKKLNGFMVVLRARNQTLSYNIFQGTLSD
jgi:hypothetical protein